MASTKILGVEIDDATYDDLLSTVDAQIASGLPHQIITANPEMLVLAHRDAGFRRVLEQADLCVADGVGLILAARLLGRPLRGRVTGSDGIYRLAEHAAGQGHRLFLLGAAEGVAEQAGQVLCGLNPGLQIAGTYAGSPQPAEEERIVACVRAASADVLLVAYGVPAEEIWIARNRDRLGVPVMIGVGGSFDFVAGVTKRAPRWVRRVGMEWLHRLIREPWRWRRQLALPVFMALVARQWLGRFRWMRAGSEPEGMSHGGQEGYDEPR